MCETTRLLSLQGFTLLLRFNSKMYLDCPAAGFRSFPWQNVSGSITYHLSIGNQRLRKRTSKHRTSISHQNIVTKCVIIMTTINVVFDTVSNMILKKSFFTYGKFLLQSVTSKY